MIAGAQFTDIEKSFEGDQVGPGGGKSPHLFAEDLDHLIEAGIPDRLEETAGRADGGGDEAACTGRLRAISTARALISATRPSRP